MDLNLNVFLSIRVRPRKSAATKFFYLASFQIVMSDIAARLQSTCRLGRILARVNKPSLVINQRILFSISEVTANDHG
jgi:hypothetical protein